MGTSNDTMKVVGALVIGAAAGAALGVLFAPRKGAETRKKIIGGAKDAADNMKKMAKHEAKSLKEKAGKLEKEAQHQLDKIKTDVVHKVADKATEKVLDAVKK